jgi:1-hydroxycarotenoid 3,4-desaturase
MRAQHVVVVGAGIGGLVAALELASRDLRVTLLERAAAPGGKMRQVVVGGRAMDAGPTVFTMRWVLDELLSDLGENLDRHLALQPASTLARHAWSSGATLDLFADVQASADAIGDFAGAREARGYLGFCRRARDIYAALERPYLRGSRPNPLSLLVRAGWRGLPQMARISPFATLWSALGQHFSDPRLRQLFGRYATYCGSSPFSAPATLMLVAHVEQAGVWQVQGGMHRVAACLAELAAQRGVRIRYGVHVDELLAQAGRIAGVRISGLNDADVPHASAQSADVHPHRAEHITADAVVFNGDAAALRAGLLGPAAQGAMPRHRWVPGGRRSLSALTWNLLADTEGFDLQHHNVFLSDDYAREFDDLFQHARLPTEPTVYVCAQDRHDTAHAGKATAQRLLCLVNAPASGDAHAPTPKEMAECEQQTFQQLARCGLRLRYRTEHCLRTTPADFAAMFPATGGALYGQASHGWAASFTRPGSRTRLQGLYLAGGSTHPGPGVPMAVLSGRLAAASVLQDLSSVSTARFQLVVMPGGISTR